MKTSTDVLIGAMRVLAREIKSGDGVANAAIAEAADRLQELHNFHESMRLRPIEDAAKESPVASQTVDQLDLAKFEGHAPGPWKIIDGHYPGFIEVIGPSFKLVIVTSATNLDFSDYMKRHADARLIAAAPDILAEVRENRETIQAQANEIAQLRERVGPGNLGQQQIDQHTKPLHAEIEQLRQQVEKMKKLATILLKLHDAKVDVAEPWDQTFEEVRTLLHELKSDPLSSGVGEYYIDENNNKQFRRKTPGKEDRNEQ